MANIEISASEKYRRRQDVLDKVTLAAVKGERCPMSYEFEKGGNAILVELAREGLIRIRVYAKNWRTVTIMQGKHKGKSTKAPPAPWEFYRNICKGEQDWPTKPF